jgi:glycosyltransferase involved in cell wall biosynthesis
MYLKQYKGIFSFTVQMVNLFQKAKYSRKTKVFACGMSMQFSIANKIFDVIIPTKNSAKTFSSCIKGLLRSDVPIGRIILVDKSTDKTPEIAQKFGCDVISSEANYSQALRIGAKSAKTDYILMLDSDVIINKRFYSNLKGHLGKFFVIKGIHRHQSNWKELSDWLFDTQMKKIHALEAAFVHRRTFIKLTKRWKEGHLDAGGDTWLYQVCKQLHIPVYFSPAVVSIHLTEDFRQLFNKERWYGKSARKSAKTDTVITLKDIVLKVMASPFVGLSIVFRYKSLQLFPFLITYRFHRLWGYAFD